jgi:hypothetical protein
LGMNDMVLHKELESHLILYRAKKPYREGPTVATPGQ